MNKLLSLVVIGLLLLGMTSSCTPDSGITLGLMLNQLADQVQTIVRTAGQAGRGVVVQAGSEVYLAIQAAKVAFGDSLDKGIDKLDKVAERKLQELETLVHDLQQGTTDLAKDIAARAQQLVNTLPFANMTPQVTSFGPSLLPWESRSASALVLNAFGHNWEGWEPLPLLEVPVPFSDKSVPVAISGQVGWVNESIADSSPRDQGALWIEGWLPGWYSAVPSSPHDFVGHTYFKFDIDAEVAGSIKVSFSTGPDWTWHETRDIYINKGMNTVVVNL
jgi:hypothetical protein